MKAVALFVISIIGTMVGQEVAIERLIDQGRLTEARSRVDELLADTPVPVRAIFLDAMLLYRENHPAEALTKLNRVLAREPDHANAHKLAALVLVALRQPDQAGIHIREAVRLAPRDFMALYYLGLHQLDGKQPEEAVATFARAVQLNAGYPDLYTMLGYAHEQLGHEPEALANYQKAVELTERHGIPKEFPYLYLGRFLVAQGRPAEALPVAERASLIRPSNVETWLLVGRVRLSLGKYPEAVAAFEQAAAVAPRDRRVCYQLMQAFQRMGRAEDARREKAKYESMASEELSRWEEGVQGPNPERNN